MGRKREREYGEGSLTLRGGRWHITYSHRGQGVQRVAGRAPTARLPFGC